MPLKPKHPAARHLGPPLVRCSEYLAFVRRHPCIICYRDGAQAHHWGPHGLGKKAPDWLAIPLCAECHRAWHEQPWSITPRDDMSLFSTVSVALEYHAATAQRDLLVAWLMEQEASQPEGF